MNAFALLLAVAAASANPPTASIEVQLTALRSARGSVHLCLTRNRAYFPNCERDPQAITRTVSAAAGKIRFKDLPTGRYALCVIHDENANSKLDKFAGIPKEGFGFSRNPVIRFGPPQFDKVSIELTPGFARTSVRMQYLL